ncbi:MAG: D-alanyl-D-alanine carboxypeptidase/D-alanyl-D-alanine-endopeptidase [Pseudonocardia sp.]|nr:D-alanyl-D-alanine carboxypeptidase/D-alanyl-D-alanine-endopeptidase [Pseudonocardia sp.]
MVLAVAAAGGGAVALSAPTLLSDLGISRTASAAANIPAPVPQLVPLAGTAPTPSGTGLTSVLGPVTGGSGLGDFGGVVVDPAAPRGSGPLWQLSPDEPLVPGSTGKLLTAGAALLTLDSTERFATRVVTGATPDTVVLVGGGDPTLTALPAGQNSVYPDPARLDDLVADVKKALPNQNIRKVVIDTSAWTGPTLAEGWDPTDVPGGFVAPMVPLMLDGGRVDPTAQDGPRVDDPAEQAGVAFAKKLGLSAKAVSVGTAPPDAQDLGTALSAPVSQLVEHLMTTSDNVLAEALARRVAITRQGDPSFVGSAKETLAALSQAGFDVTGATMVDGSGLSTADRVPPRLLGALLAAAAAPSLGPDDTEFLRPIISGLPVAGGDGTLEDRFGTGVSAEGRGVVRAKTGTLTGVSSLAGVVTDVDGRLLVFAMMSNGVSPATVRPKLDTIAATLSRCGCR